MKKRYKLGIATSITLTIVVVGAFIVNRSEFSAKPPHQTDVVELSETNLSTES
jgi:hypothetical protein